MKAGDEKTKRLLFICGLLFPPNSSTNLFCRCSLCQGAGWSEEGAAQSNNVWRMTLVQQRCMGEKRRLRSQQCRTRTKPLQTSWTHNLLQGELDDALFLIVAFGVGDSSIFGDTFIFTCESSDETHLLALLLVWNDIISLMASFRELLRWNGFLLQTGRVLQ